MLQKRQWFHICQCVVCQLWAGLLHDDDEENTVSGEALCYTVVFEDAVETPSTQELRSTLEEGSDDDKLDTLRRIIVATSINGNPQVGIHAFVRLYG
jgi:hypothetical protein